MRDIFVISGPGGVGKGTLVRELIARDATLDLSRSWTTRPQRLGEPDDAYVFVSPAEFQKNIDNGGFLEWVEFLGARYGTPVPDLALQGSRSGSSDSADVVDGVVSNEISDTDTDTARPLLLEIELEGAQRVKSLYPTAFLILVEPPTREDLYTRLSLRGDTPERIAQRLAKGAREIELGRKIADATLINDDLTTAVADLQAIINSHRAATS